MIRGKAAQRLNLNKREAWLAWHIAALVRAEKMPRLERLMPAKPKPEPKPFRQQSPEELMAVMRIWAARGVGTIQ